MVGRFGGGIISPLSPPIGGSNSTDSRRARLVRYAVESVGSRVIGDVARYGEKAFIKCDAVSDVEDFLRRRVMASGIRDIKFHRHGPKVLFIQFRDFSKAPRKKMREELVCKIGEMVQMVHQELEVLREYMLRKKFTDRLDAAGLEERDSIIRKEFHQLRSQYPKYQVFDAATKHPELKLKLMEHLPRSRQFVLRAQEFAAVLLEEKLAVVKEAWFQFKNKSKTPKIRVRRKRKISNSEFCD